jgi:hypothetical protein
MERSEKGRDSMRYDHASLDRALDALQPQEVPADLHARLVATPELAASMLGSASFIRPLELWVLGIALAVATWLVLVVVGNPLAGGPVAAQAVQNIFDRIVGLLGSALGPGALLWLAVGGSAALWLSQLGSASEAGLET